MRKLLSVCIALLLLISLAVPAAAAEGFIYCDPLDLINDELNQQHFALNDLSRETGIQLELYFLTYDGEGLPMDRMAEVLYENKEEKPEQYLSVLIQVGKDADGYTLHETYPWHMFAMGDISENKVFLNSLDTVLTELITQENWSGPLEEDQLTANLTAYALIAAAENLYGEMTAPAMPHVIDHAQLLTMEQRQELNAYAEGITNQYGIGVYVMSVPDFRDYGEEPQIFDVLWNYYHDNGLGYGEDREGMILMLSMAERDFATFYYGEDTEYAFNGFGQRQQENDFLDNFGDDDWYGGFHDFLSSSEAFMEKAAAGEPVRENPWQLAMVFILIALFISLCVTRLLWMRMANVEVQKGAGHYETAVGLVLTHQSDQFLHQTETRREIQSSGSGSGSQAHSGGGGSGRSGKF